MWQTHSLKGPQADARLRQVGAEGMALAAFSAIVPDNVLALTPRGILNVHPSLLPHWRGAAPIQSALLAGDRHTGVSIIRLVSALDAGPIVLQERTTIEPEDDYVSLEPRLAALGARLLVRALEESPQPVPQDEAAATFSRRIERDDARIDWTQPSVAIWNQVRAYRGWPQAFTGFDGLVFKVLRAWPLPRPDALPLDGDAAALVGTCIVSGDGAAAVITGQGLLRLDEVQLEGKRAQSGSEFLRGYARLQGAKLA